MSWWTRIFDTFMQKLSFPWNLGWCCWENCQGCYIWTFNSKFLERCGFSIRTSCSNEVERSIIRESSFEELKNNDSQTLIDRDTKSRRLKMVKRVLYLNNSEDVKLLCFVNLVNQYDILECTRVSIQLLLEFCNRK